VPLDEMGTVPEWSNLSAGAGQMVGLACPRRACHAHGRLCPFGSGPLASVFEQGAVWEIGSWPVVEVVAVGTETHVVRECRGDGGERGRLIASVGSRCAIAYWELADAVARGLPRWSGSSSACRLVQSMFLTLW